MVFLVALLMAAGGGKGVPIFNALRGYTDMPDLAPFGLTPVALLGGQLWGSHEVAQRAEQAPLLPPDIDKQLTSLAATISSEHPALVCLDVEWRITDSGAQAAANRGKLLHMATIFRRALHGIPMGFYGELPVVDYWRTVAAPDSPKYRSWQEDNRRVAELASHVDIVFPSLYTFYHDLEGWKRHAQSTIKEARAYGKPVYVFLWPEFHNSNRMLAGHELDGAFWRAELSLASDLADGIVIWGWGNNAKKWNPKAEWWKVTLEFIRAHSPAAR
jgi:hypothetical protein